MESNLENMPLSLVMDMLEATAQKHDLLLSTNLIDFADDIWALATLAVREELGLSKQVSEYQQADNYMKNLIKQRQAESGNAWLEWVDSNSYGMKTLKGKK
jgi:hypothetical protein